MCNFRSIQCAQIALRSFCRSGCRPGRTRCCPACRGGSVLRACARKAVTHHTLPPRACMSTRELRAKACRSYQSCSSRHPACPWVSTNTRRSSERCSLQMLAIWEHDEAPPCTSRSVPSSSQVVWPFLAQLVARAEVFSTPRLRGLRSAVPTIDCFDEAKLVLCGHT